MEALPATVVAVVIDKPSFASRYSAPANPYDYAMELGLERTHRHLATLGQPRHRTAIIVEKRGRREDMPTWNSPSGASVTVPTP